MPQKSNHDSLYPYVCVGTFVPMLIKDILTKNSCFAAIQNTSKTYNDMKSGIDLKTIIVVDTSLYSFKVPSHESAGKN